MAREAAHLPPRGTLPHDIVIAPLPGLSTTWYDRGAGYWVRRAGLSLLWALITALFIAITVGLLVSIHHKSLVGFYLALGVEVAYSLGLLAFFTVRTVRQWDDPTSPLLASGRARRPAAAKDTRPPRARARSAAGTLLIAPSFLFPGLYLAMFVSSLLPETPPERRVRLRLTETLRQRGYLPSV